MRNATRTQLPVTINGIITIYIKTCYSVPVKIHM